MKSRAWRIGVGVGSALLLVVGFGGLLLLQSSRSSANTTLLFVIFFGIVTFGFFAGPGLVFSARKRIPWVKELLPGGTLAWIRAHLYMPMLALVAAWVHASIVPFRAVLSSGKVLLVLALLVSAAGVARSRMIGIAKSAVNADVKINKIAAPQSRRFRQIVIDYKQLRRPTEDIQRDIGTLNAAEQSAWQEIVAIQDQIDDRFPRGGKQSNVIRILKVARAAHAPLTIGLFLVLIFHIFAVLGGTQATVGSDETAFATNAQCADCHSAIADELASSSMGHAQTGTIMEAQLPITLAKNDELAAQLGGRQAQINAAASQTCVNCHAPVGSRFAGAGDLFPLDEAPPGGTAPTSGNDAVTSDGISCITCHTQNEPFEELAGFGTLDINSGGARDYGTMFGPLFSEPNALPVSVHDVGGDSEAFWNDPVTTSFACGACHNVKVDLDGDGLSPFGAGNGDNDGDFQLDANELDNQDGTLDDLVLQTTFDEWQDYLAGFDERFGDANLVVDRPLGCVECHMPAVDAEPVVDFAPGFNSLPDRPRRQHTFVGVDYDLDPAEYEAKGLDASVVNEVLADRRALLQSAVTLEVVDSGAVAGAEYRADVVVRNNLLGHSFPTGFAFARQFWIEVTAESASGRPVCLLAIGELTTCSSGVIESTDAPLPQCDPVSIAASLGRDRFDVANGTIDFADALPVGECDPWLANFQKILTDGDPDGDGIFTEVAYQAFLPDIVKIRERVIDGLAMTELQPVRLREVNGELVEDGAKSIQYIFDTSSFPAGEQITVTARMRFRHLPPEFIRSLESELALLDGVPQSAFIDAEELIANLVVTDVVTATSGSGEVLECQGPQNIEGASIVDCVEPVSGDGAVDVAAAPFGRFVHPAAPDPVSITWVLSGLAAVAVLAMAVLTARRGYGAFGALPTIDP